MEKEALKLRQGVRESAKDAIMPLKNESGKMSLKQTPNGDYIFTDKEGKKQILRKNLADEWLETFNLKSLDEDFVPEILPQIQEKLGKNIRINLNDLLKIDKKQRQKFIKFIKPTFEEPDLVFKDEKGDVLFAKNIDDNLCFVNITREYDKEFLSVSQSPKKQSTLKNKLERMQELYYKKPDSELRDSSAHKASTGVLPSASKKGLE